MKQNDLEEAWTLLEDAMTVNKTENAKPISGGATESLSDDLKINKRKMESELLEEAKADEPVKKKKKTEENGEHQIDESSQKFKWGAVIKKILSSKNKEVKLKKLKSKVKKHYLTFTGCEWNDGMENKFNKKINKLKGIQIDDEKVRLISLWEFIILK